MGRAVNTLYSDRFRQQIANMIHLLPNGLKNVLTVNGQPVSLAEQILNGSMGDMRQDEDSTIFVASVVPPEDIIAFFNKYHGINLAA